jgi:hypothetical protein
VWLTIGILRVLILWVRALLRELLGWRRTWVLLLLLVVLAIHKLGNVSKLTVGLGKLTLAVDIGHHKEQDSDSDRAGSRLVPEGRTRRTLDIAAAALRNNLAVVADSLVAGSLAVADSLEVARTPPDSVQANRIGSAGTAGCTAGCIDCRGQT